MKIILPKTFVEYDPSYGPIFFLAGPVRGGNDWQKDAVEELKKHLDKFYVAIPYYYNNLGNFPLMNQREPGIEGKFIRQLNWERHYIDLASKHGCLIFWLPEESITNPRLPHEGAYATDTRGEIARASVELRYNPKNRVVLGAQEGFHSLSQIQRNFALDQGGEGDEKYNFYNTLQLTIENAVKKSLGK
jgi:hypothetical protein